MIFNGRSRPIRMRIATDYASSREEIVRQAEIRRLEREELERKQTAARRILRAWRFWRGRRELMLAAGGHLHTLLLLFNQQKRKGIQSRKRIGGRGGGGDDDGRNEEDGQKKEEEQEVWGWDAFFELFASPHLKNFKRNGQDVGSKDHRAAAVVTLTTTTFSTGAGAEYIRCSPECWSSMKEALRRFFWCFSQLYAYAYLRIPFIIFSPPFLGDDSTASSSSSGHGETSSSCDRKLAFSSSSTVPTTSMTGTTAPAVAADGTNLHQDSSSPPLPFPLSSSPFLLSSSSSSSILAKKIPSVPSLSSEDGTYLSSLLSECASSLLAEVLKKLQEMDDHTESKGGTSASFSSCLPHRHQNSTNYHHTAVEKMEKEEENHNHRHDHPTSPHSTTTPRSRTSNRSDNSRSRVHVARRLRDVLGDSLLPSVSGGLVGGILLGYQYLCRRREIRKNTAQKSPRGIPHHREEEKEWGGGVDEKEEEEEEGEIYRVLLVWNTLMMIVGTGEPLRPCWTEKKQIPPQEKESEPSEEEEKESGKKKKEGRWGEKEMPSSSSPLLLLRSQTQEEYKKQIEERACWDSAGEEIFVVGISTFQRWMWSLAKAYEYCQCASSFLSSPSSLVFLSTPPSSQHHQEEEEEEEKERNDESKEGARERVEEEGWKEKYIPKGKIPPGAAPPRVGSPSSLLLSPSPTPLSSFPIAAGDGAQGIHGGGGGGDGDFSSPPPPPSGGTGGKKKKKHRGGRGLSRHYILDQISLCSFLLYHTYTPTCLLTLHALTPAFLQSHARNNARCRQGKYTVPGRERHAGLSSSSSLLSTSPSSTLPPPPNSPTISPSKKKEVISPWKAICWESFLAPVMTEFSSTSCSPSVEKKTINKRNNKKEMDHHHHHHHHTSLLLTMDPLSFLTRTCSSSSSSSSSSSLLSCASCCSMTHRWQLIQYILAEYLPDPLAPWRNEEAGVTREDHCPGLIFRTSQEEERRRKVRRNGGARGEDGEGENRGGKTMGRNIIPSITTGRSRSKENSNTNSSSSGHYLDFSSSPHPLSTPYSFSSCCLSPSLFKSFSSSSCCCGSSRCPPEPWWALSNLSRFLPLFISMFEKTIQKPIKRQVLSVSGEKCFVNSDASSPLPNTDNKDNNAPHREEEEDRKKKANTSPPCGTTTVIGHDEVGEMKSPIANVQPPHDPQLLQPFFSPYRVFRDWTEVIATLMYRSVQNASFMKLLVLALQDTRRGVKREDENDAKDEEEGGAETLPRGERRTFIRSPSEETTKKTKEEEVGGKEEESRRQQQQQQPPPVSFSSAGPTVRFPFSSLPSREPPYWMGRRRNNNNNTNDRNSTRQALLCIAHWYDADGGLFLLENVGYEEVENFSLDSLSDVPPVDHYPSTIATSSPPPPAPPAFSSPSVRWNRDSSRGMLDSLCTVFSWPLLHLRRKESSEEARASSFVISCVLRSPTVIPQLWTLYKERCSAVKAIYNDPHTLRSLGLSPPPPLPSFTTSSSLPGMRTASSGFSGTRGENIAMKDSSSMTTTRRMEHENIGGEDGGEALSSCGACEYFVPMPLNWTPPHCPLDVQNRIRLLSHGRMKGDCFSSSSITTAHAENRGGGGLAAHPYAEGSTAVVSATCLTKRFYDPHPELSVLFFTLLLYFMDVVNPEDICRGVVLNTETLHILVLYLRDVVVRSHVYGVVPYCNGEAVARLAFELLVKLRTINEAEGIVRGNAGLWWCFPEDPQTFIHGMMRRKEEEAEEEKRNKTKNGIHNDNHHQNKILSGGAEPHISHAEERFNLFQEGRGDPPHQMTAVTHLRGQMRLKGEEEYLSTHFPEAFYVHQWIVKLTKTNTPPRILSLMSDVRSAQDEDDEEEEEEDDENSHLVNDVGIIPDTTTTTTSSSSATHSTSHALEHAAPTGSLAQGRRHEGWQHPPEEEHGPDTHRNHLHNLPSPPDLHHTNRESILVSTFPQESRHEGEEETRVEDGGEAHLRGDGTSGHSRSGGETTTAFFPFLQTDLRLSEQSRRDAREDDDDDEERERRRGRRRMHDNMGLGQESSAHSSLGLVLPATSPVLSGAPFSSTTATTTTFPPLPPLPSSPSSSRLPLALPLVPSGGVGATTAASLEDNDELDESRRRSGKNHHQHHHWKEEGEEGRGREYRRRLPGEDRQFANSCGWSDTERVIRLLLQGPFLFPFTHRANFFSSFFLSVSRERFSQMHLLFDDDENHVEVVDGVRRVTAEANEELSTEMTVNMNPIDDLWGRLQRVIWEARGTAEGGDVSHDTARNEEEHPVHAPAPGRTEEPEQVEDVGSGNGESPSLHDFMRLVVDPESLEVSTTRAVLDAERRMRRTTEMPIWRNNRVRRDHIFGDAFDCFRHSVNTSFFSTIKFYDSFLEDGDDANDAPRGGRRHRGRRGQEVERGVGHGVFRDAVILICQDGFAAEYGLFCQTPDGALLYPNPYSFEVTGDREHLEKISFLGAVLGRAMQEGIVQNLPLAPHFINHLLGRRNTLAHLKAYDKGLYTQLVQLLSLSEERLEELGLTFTVVEEVLSEMREIELLEGGRDLLVSRQNVLHYVQLMGDFYLNRRGYSQVQAFKHGLTTLIPKCVLQLFDGKEASLLITGNQKGKFDVEDWRRHTTYNPEGAEHSITVELFWKVVESMTAEEQSKLLRFSTSTLFPPLLGFQFLSPGFNIQLLPPEDLNRLPSASTCFCVLRLPRYTSFDILKSKLLTAIEQNTFELT